jgi:tRNA A-37 threonylcarbamoyl transferase component Bud32
LAKKQEIIRYKTMPNWLVPTALSCSAAASLWVVLLSPKLVVIFPTLLFGLHGPAIVMETFIRALLLLVFAVLAFMLYEYSRYDILVISEKGIKFPIAMAPGLLFRRRRPWEDVANILLGSMLMHDKKGAYEYDLEAARDRKKLFIYFKSGGHATIDMNRMPKESVEKLFSAVESWCLSSSRVPPPTKPRQPKKLTQTQLDNLSYTQMWEEELQSHFSATNFVPLEKGRQLKDGNFSILMHLASGGLSAVYLAEQEDETLVVLKEAALPPTLDQITKEKAQEMFRREALILRKLNHRRIAKVLDSFVENGRDYLAIEFVPGESLRQVVRKHGVQSEKNVLQYAVQICDILTYLHDHFPPIVHRDITPDNLILREDGQVFLIDFGAANQYLGIATGTIVGKQAYIAPEQFRGKAQVQSDIYALGCTLHFLLTAADPEALSESHPKTLRNDLSDRLDQLVASSTAVDTVNRIDSASKLKELAQSLITGSSLKMPIA